MTSARKTMLVAAGSALIGAAIGLAITLWTIHSMFSSFGKLVALT
jgi:hypothetical protein